MEERHTEQEGSSPASNTPDSPVTSSEKPLHLSGSPPAARVGVEEPEAEPVPKGPLMFTFSGKTGEFFKIWIVNILLTICTVGIYSAWAKVRTKRYFYGNTSINGNSFAYHANPVSILVARLNVAVLIIAVLIVAVLIADGGYWLGEGILGNAIYLTFLLFYLTFLPLFLPWAMVRGFAFNARNSSYRNVRFHFHKKYLPLYLIYSPYIVSFLLAGWLAEWLFTGYYFFGIEIFALSLLFFILPVARVYHRYKAGQHSLGDIPFHFGKAGLFQYFLVIGKAILSSIFFFFLAAAVMVAVYLFIGYSIYGYYPLSPFSSWAGLTLLFGAYFSGTIIFFLLIYQYVGACLFSLFWQNLKFEGGHFDCTIKPLTFFFKILLVNAFAIILSVGLLYPWAKIRRSRYVAEHLSVHIEDAAVLSRIKRAGATEEGALGEEFEAVQRFDFDIGLV